MKIFVQFTRAVEYTDWASAEVCLGYDTIPSDVPVMLELWGKRRNASLPSLPGPLWPRVIAPDRVLSMG